MWVLIDNYDSFTHILHHYLLQSGFPCRVVRNDAISLEALIDLRPERLILSPGPETPAEAGITMTAVDHFHRTIPILGICLGHQALGMYFGGRLTHADAPRHGKLSAIHHSGTSVFRDLPQPLQAMRYHSLIITGLEDTQLEVTATDGAGAVMAFRHRQWACTGIQFHPESVGTPAGLQLIANWADHP
jgi:anthranilate synthase/aminodeoxychorismate synthase-like glutamine amidotransferase